MFVLKAMETYSVWPLFACVAILFVTAATPLLNRDPYR
jgi:hypothetical protein